jgi:hypothetical protein
MRFDDTHLRRERRHLRADGQRARLRRRELGLARAELDTCDAVAVCGDGKRGREPVGVDVAARRRRRDGDAVAVHDEARVAGADDPVAEPRPHDVREPPAIEHDGEPVRARPKLECARDLRRRERAAPRAVVVDRDRRADVGARRLGRAACRRVADRGRDLGERRDDPLRARRDRAHERGALQLQADLRGPDDRLGAAELDARGLRLAAEQRDRVDVRVRPELPDRRDVRPAERERRARRERRVRGRTGVESQHVAAAHVHGPLRRVDLDDAREPRPRGAHGGCLDAHAVAPGEVGAQDVDARLRLAAVAHGLAGRGDRDGHDDAAGEQDPQLPHVRQ